MQTPPHSEAIERAALGCLLLDPSLIKGSGLSPSDFYFSDHKALYAGMQALSGRGESVDYLTLADESGRGVGLISGLDVDVSLDSWGSYRAKVLDYSARRRLWQMGQEVVRDVATERAAPVAERALSLVREVISDSRAGEHLGLGEIAEMPEDRRIPTGMHALDRRMGGGLGKTWSIVAAGYAASGKTSFALSLARAAARQNRKVLFISMEMKARQLYERWLRMQDADKQREVLDWDISVCDRLPAGPEALASEIYRAKPGTDLVLVDHLQKVPVQESSEYVTVSKTTGLLAETARDQEVTILALSQLSRPPKGQKVPPPSLAALRGSGTIEQDADVVLGVWRPAQFNLPEPDEISILKHRHGPENPPLVEGMFWWAERGRWV